MMRNKSIKLIVTDLDGTLLDGDEKVPHAFFEQIERLTEQGVKVVIASGRQYFNIKNLFDHQAQNLYFVGDNGALGYFQDELFHATYLPWKKAFELVKIGKTIPGVIPLISASQNTFFEKGNEEIVKFIRRFYRHCVIVNDFVDIETKHEIPLKVAFYDLAGVKNNSLKLFKNNIPGVVATQSNVHWLDIAPEGTNKGEAIKTLQKKYGISQEETMAFGDYHNDIEMLEVAKYSFAVASAQEEVKALADYQCASNKDIGVIDVINELLNNEGKSPEKLFEKYRK
ncbi:MAG: HAD family hydrolase [Bacteroidales bacterium]|jgi:Cof subfamily protein (haloacid dehalogenase superfamily)|nr:HAD family hydrolase [Bacteroidales bacterium]